MMRRINTQEDGDGDDEDDDDEQEEDEWEHTSAYTRRNITLGSQMPTSRLAGSSRQATVQLSVSHVSTSIRLDRDCFSDPPRTVPCLSSTRLSRTSIPPYLPTYLPYLLI
jgi:hypothetical protein